MARRRAATRRRDRRNLTVCFVFAVLIFVAIVWGPEWLSWATLGVVSGWGFANLWQFLPGRCRECHRLASIPFPLPEGFFERPWYDIRRPPKDAWVCMQHVGWAVSQHVEKVEKNRNDPPAQPYEG